MKLWCNLAQMGWNAAGCVSGLEQGSAARSRDCALAGRDLNREKVRCLYMANVTGQWRNVGTASNYRAERSTRDPR